MPPPRTMLKRRSNEALQQIGRLARSSVKFASAKSGDGIVEAFAELAETICRRQL